MTSATQPPHGFVLNVGHEAEARLIILWVTVSYWLQGRGSDTERDLFLKKMPRAICIDRMDCYPFFFNYILVSLYSQTPLKYCSDVFTPFSVDTFKTI